MFRFRPNHKTSHVLNENKRNFLLITVCNKTSCFIRAIRINYATKLHFAIFSFYNFSLICNNSYSPTVNSSIASNNRLSVSFFVGFKFRIINQAINNFHHIILLITSFRKNSVDIFFFQRRFFSFNSAKTSFCVVAHFVNDISDFVQSILVI